MNDCKFDPDGLELCIEDGRITTMNIYNRPVKTITAYFVAARREGLLPEAIDMMRENISWMVLKNRMYFEINTGLFLTDPDVLEDLPATAIDGHIMQDVKKAYNISRALDTRIQDMVRGFINDNIGKDVVMVNFERRQIDAILKIADDCTGYNGLGGAMAEITEMIDKVWKENIQCLAKKCITQIIRETYGDTLKTGWDPSRYYYE